MLKRVRTESSVTMPTSPYECIYVPSMDLVWTPVPMTNIHNTQNIRERTVIREVESEPKLTSEMI